MTLKSNCIFGKLNITFVYGEGQWPIVYKYSAKESNKTKKTESD